MKVICIGDSLTYGYGISSKENWVSLLNEKYKMDFINKGINGDTSGGMLSRFYRDVVDEQPKCVIIMGGTNDFIVENSLGAVKANIMAMVHQAYYHGITPIIGISTKIDVENVRKDWASLTDIRQLDDKMVEYRDWIINFSKAFNVLYVDFYTQFQNKTSEKYSNYFIDGLHPSPAGHQIMADIVYQCIVKWNLF